MGEGKGMERGEEGKRGKESGVGERERERERERGREREREREREKREKKRNNNNNNTKDSSQKRIAGAFGSLRTGRVLLCNSPTLGTPALQCRESRATSPSHTASAIDPLHMTSKARTAAHLTDSR